MRAFSGGMFALSLALVALAMQVPVAPAGAAEIGAVGEIAASELPSPLAEGGFTVQAAEASGTYAVPAGYGTVTGWRHSTGTASGTLTFKILRPTGTPKEFTVVASDTRSVTASTVHAFGVRIPVRPGDRLGLFSDDVQLAYETNNPADKIGFFASDLAIGATRATDGEPFEGFKLDVAVTLEPDPAGGGGGPPPPPAPGTGHPAPVLSQLRVAPSSFLAAAGGTSTRRSPATSSGAKVSFRVDVAASMRFTVRRTRPGRRTGSGSKRRCVAETTSNRGARACVRHVPVPGGFTRTATRGANAFYFTGRVAGRRLTPGSYTLVATPSTSGTTGTPVQRSFAIKAQRAGSGAGGG